MARKKNFVQYWRETCGLSKTEAAMLLGMTVQRYHYMETYSKAWPKDCARICAIVWAERTEKSAEEFYAEYHQNA